MSVIKLEYNIPFICHALLDYEINSNYGNNITDTIKNFKKISLNDKLSEFKIYCDQYLNEDENEDKDENEDTNEDEYKDKINFDFDKKFIIINVIMESHASSLIIDNENKKIILVNTGYKINTYHYKYYDNTYSCFKIYSELCYNNLLKIIKEIKFYNTNIYINNLSDLDKNITLLKKKGKSILINKYDQLYLLLAFLDIIIYDNKQIIYDNLNILLEKASLSENNKSNILNIKNYYLHDEYKHYLIPIIYYPISNNDYDDIKYQNIFTYNYDIFKKNNINQIAGSCTFYSIIMCFYYIYYIEILEDYNKKFKLLLIDIQNYLIEYLLTFKLNNYNIYIFNNYKYSNQLLLSLFKIINRKYENKLINNIIDFYKNDDIIKYNALIIERKTIIDNDDNIKYIKCKYTGIIFTVNTIIDSIFYNMINFLKEDNLLNVLTKLINYNYFVKKCIDNINKQEYIKFIFKNINNDDNVLYFLYYIVLYFDRNFIDNKYNYFNSYIIHFMKKTTNFKLTSFDNFKAFLICIYFLLYNRFSLTIDTSIKYIVNSYNFYILSQLFIIFLKVLKYNEINIFNNISFNELEFELFTDIDIHIYISDFNDKLILSNLIHYFKNITPLNKNYESILYSLLKDNYKCLFNLINYILVFNLENDIYMQKYMKNNYSLPEIYSEIAQEELKNFYDYIVINKGSINIKQIQVVKDNDTFNNPLNSIYNKDYLNNTINLIQIDNYYILPNSISLHQKINSEKISDKFDYSIYNYPKLLLHNNLITCDNDILYKNFEKFKLPLTFDNSMNKLKVIDYPISNYIDEKQNFYYEEYLDFITSFNLLLFDNLKIYNINTLFLVYIQYHYYYHDNERDIYFNNKNYLKLKSYLIVNFINKKNNYKYFFNIIKFSFDIIDNKNFNYILLINKINDYSNIILEKLNEKIILKYNIIDYKYKNYIFINKLLINNIEYYKFKNEDNNEIILLSNDMVELFIDYDLNYYINYNENKYILNLEHNINLFNFYLKENKNYNIDVNNIITNNHLIFNYDKFILIIINSNNQNYYLYFEQYTLISITLNNIIYNVYNKYSNLPNQLKYILNLINGLYVLLTYNNDYYIFTIVNYTSNSLFIFYNNKILYDYINSLVLTKLVQVYDNNIFIPDIQNIIEATCFYNFCINTYDYNLYSLIFNKLKYFLGDDCYMGYFGLYYKDMFNETYINNINKYYKIYNESNPIFDFNTFLYYPSPNYLHTENNTLNKYIEFKLKQTNNIKDDNIYRHISGDITQKTIINKIIDDIKKKNSRIYELIMGFGKSKFIIPYVIYFIKYIESSITSTYEIINNNNFNKFNEIFIICPQHLVKDMFDILFKYIDLLPKNINLKQFINYNDKYIFNSGQITVMSDTFIKYILLTNSTILTTNINRLILVDEIDNLMDPSVSQFNLTKKTNNDIPFKYFLFNIIYDILIYYYKINKYKITKDSIKNIFTKDSLFKINHTEFDELINTLNHYINSNLSTSIDKIEIYKLMHQNKNSIIVALNSYILCSLYNKKNICNKKIDSNNLTLLFLLKKIYNIIKQLDILIINKHYGFSHDFKNKSYYFAQPYIGLNIPSKDSVYNDYILTVVMTINLFINNELRDSDIINIIDIINNLDNDTLEYYKLNDIYKELEDMSYDNILIYLRNYINTKDNKFNIIRLYLNKFILDKITYINLFTNTSFIEILNHNLYSTCIGFTGTTETIDIIPIINNYPIFNKTYSIEKFKQDAYDGLVNSKSKSKTNYIKVDSTKELDENIIEILKSNNTYQVIIDNGAFLRFKTIKEYVNIFLNECNRTHVIYFNNNHKAMVMEKTKEYYYDNNIELLKDKNYLIFFDINHCRGTDIKISKCHGLLTLNNFNISVDTLQSLYRLRNINHDDEDKRQTVDYIYANIDDINILTIKEYLCNKTIKYNKSKHKEFYKQCINSELKIIVVGFNKIKYISDDIESFIFKLPNDKVKSINKDFENTYYYNLICKNKYKNNNCDKYYELINNPTQQELISYSQSQIENQIENQNENQIENQTTELIIFNKNIKYCKLKLENIINDIKLNLNTFKINLNGKEENVILYQKYMFDKI
jgi:hypothetical protein